MAVYGRSDEAVERAQELYGWTKHVPVCLEDGSDRVNSKNARWIAASGCKVETRPLKRLVGDSGGKLDALELDDGERVRCDALFLSAALRQSCALA